MTIPKYIKKLNRIYEFVKAYKNFYLYQDTITKRRISFTPYDLGLIKPVKVEKLRRTERKKMNYLN